MPKRALQPATPAPNKTNKIAQLPARKPAPRELTPLQQLIADEVGDMLVNGTHYVVIDNLLAAVVEHQAWRSLDACSQAVADPDRVESEVRSAHLPEDWLPELREEWGRNITAPAAEKTNPQTVSARIRANFLHKLREAFRNFETRATPEEIAAMLEILEVYDSMNCGCDAFGEMPLGYAIEHTMRIYSGLWLRVPEKIQEQVKAYIECLKDVAGGRPARGSK